MKFIKTLISKIFCRLCEFKYSKKSYSQEGEDILLERILWKVKNRGFYIDIGAYHPIKYSNTYKFYKLGWNGINIDAMPGSMKLFKRLRPRDINIEQAISDTNESLLYYQFNHSEINTIVKNNFELWQNSEDVKKVTKLKINTKTISQIMSDYQNSIPEIVDLLSIDIEGMDYRVLSSIDFDKHKFRFILIEDLKDNVELVINSDIYRFLIPKGYILVSKLYYTSMYQYIF